MQVVLDPVQDAAHGGWLRRTPGAYEWWYFDAVADDCAWALTCIWFLGNPFSPYYHYAARGEAADPFEHNALFFALYRHGRLHAYHFTRFPRALVCADEVRPASLRFGPNSLSCDRGAYRLSLSDENANRREVAAELTFCPPIPHVGGVGAQHAAPLPPAPPEMGAGGNHFWLPAVPVCRVAGRITLREAHNRGAETLAFSGRGYHDHNWGALPFSADIRDWYWARAAIGHDRALIVYHVNSRRPVSHLLLFDGGRLVRHDPQARLGLCRHRLNAFGTLYAARLDVQSEGLVASFDLGRRLDSAPFYIRTLCRVQATVDGQMETGTGMAEYFRPRPLSSRLAASATKARIVER
ncbi:MAG: hypothetical protein JO250_10885 [Armatimonadetes bacterium]|nr:hypothetical protein [Armatimonadota bacterium]